MHLRSGITRIAELAALQRDPFYRQHTDFNEQFLAAHRSALAAYGRRWGRHPFKLWSRRWEYPFAAQRLLESLGDVACRAGGDLHGLDAGSGVTYLPHYVVSRNARARVWCVDAAASYAAPFAAIGSTTAAARVHFLAARLQQLPFAAGVMDAVVCISVLEHTHQHQRIVDELHRVLRPGGALILTFDLSLDGKFTLSITAAAALLRYLSTRFALDIGADPDAALAHLDAAGNLTSDHVRRSEPELLPWSRPVRVVNALRDLIAGKGWTGGFRSRTVICLQGRKLAQ